mmetsp:Transcript_281/g.717  ORF Transcript_281/g.717 Transcript_281/m.717 type:complete len:255 (-) Transcript_281:381-1145(-)
MKNEVIVARRVVTFTMGGSTAIVVTTIIGAVFFLLVATAVAIATTVTTSATISGSIKLVTESRVYVFQRLVIADLGQFSVDGRVFDRVVRFEKVPHVCGVGSPFPWIKDNGCVTSHQYGHGSRARSRTGTSPGVGGDIGSHDDCVASVPSIRFYPQECVEECSSASVTSVDDRCSLDVGVSRKQIHKDCLGRLGFIYQGFGSDLQAAYLGGIDLVFFQQGMNDGQCQTVDIFGVTANPEAFLAQSKRVLSFGHP